jgi:hypothetical protein
MLFEIFRGGLSMVVKRLFTWVVLVVTVWFGFQMMGCTAFAATEAQPQNKADKILDKVSKEGNMAMRDVRWARVAIFDGQPQTAEKLLDSAKKNLDVTEKQAPHLLVALESTEKGAGVKPRANLIPIDAWMMLSEDFVPTPEKTAKIKEANEHLKKGEKGKALEILRAANIDVNITQVLMPLQATIKDVDKAMALLKENKYYEANLALKGAQDGLLYDTTAINEPIKPAKQEGTSRKK